MKLHLSRHRIEQIRALAIEEGRSEEEVDKWIEDCVILVEPMGGR